jgi:hypothetical protein
MTPALTGTPADLITYMREKIRTHDFEPLGRITEIAIAGDAARWVNPNPADPILSRWGRLMRFRNQPLGLAQTLDRTCLLPIGPIASPSGALGLPDLPDPRWTPPAWTKEETEGTVERPIEKDQPRMIPQRLEDRADRGPNGGLGRLEGTNFLVFSPVINVTFQAEQDRKLVAQMWQIIGQHDPATQTHLTLLVDAATGEALFYGGRYDILANEG